MTLNTVFDRTIFLLGAGASMDAGCLSSQGMLNDLQAQIRGLPTTDRRKSAFGGIFDFVLASLNYQHSMKVPDVSNRKGVINIEDFIMVLRQLIDREFIVPGPLIGNWNDKIIGSEFHNSHIFDEFLDYATGLLVDSWTNFDQEDASHLLAPFRSLTESAESFEAEIFTLNYDLIWERCFNSEREKLIETGFSAGRWIGDHNDPHNVAKLHLSKLHGSVDWYFDDATEEVCVAEDPVAKPLVIFGSTYKMQSFDPFISLLNKFRQSLQSATLYVIVGYSFQDRYINNILIQSLGSRLTRSAIVVDPIAWDSTEHLAKTVEETQTSRSLNEMLNLKRINPRRIEIVKSTAKNFYKDFLGNGAERLIEAVKRVAEGEPVF